MVNAVESGGSVVFTGSGSLNVSGLGAPNAVFGFGGVTPNAASISLRPGNMSSNHTAYVTTQPFSGPFSYGTGGSTFLSAFSGSIVALRAVSGSVAPSGLSSLLIGVPTGYIPGTDLGTTTARIDNATFLSLGLTPGQYIWSWGSGASADSFTLNIGAVPEPGTWAMMIAGFGLMGAALRRRPRMKATFA